MNAYKAALIRISWKFRYIHHFTEHLDLGGLHRWQRLIIRLSVHRKARFPHGAMGMWLLVLNKVIPRYGRGKTPDDPRSKPVSGIEIPNRPAGQRPEPARFSDNNLGSLILGLIGLFIPVAISAGFEGLGFPLFSVQLQGFSNANGHGGSSGYNYGYAGSFHDSGGQVNQDTSQASLADDENLKKILLVVLLLLSSRCL
ncbi:RING-type E3 ubiquitin transferase [Salvia divinorum]|uniref:RING-type E3 ubiquitin transferase n=1 Tax=Salvia divinorum TaxID=28513 RepID=A0ABD1G487_SALDI